MVKSEGGFRTNKNEIDRVEEYEPLFMEELFIVNLYGTEEEIEEFYFLLQDPDDLNNQIAMVNLIEKIKRENLTQMDWHCCSRCQHFEICKINWYRGERDIPRHCCSLCQHYKECMEKHKLEKERSKQNDDGKK
jgi:hypothetical protein